MDAGKKKCCTRDTCAVYRATSSEPPDERQQQLLATQSLPASSTGRNSTQILYVEPNFTETPSEYEVFYDCFSSDYSLSGSAKLGGSFCAKPKDLARITKRIGDAHEFRGSLQQIVYTSRKLLKSFDEAYRKDGKCRRCVREDHSDALVHADSNIRKAHSVEMTARVGNGAGGAREIQLDQCTIRIEPISFKIPLKVEVQSRKPSHTCHMTTMIQHTCQLGPKPTLEPIRTAAITAQTTQTMGPLPVQTALLPLALPAAEGPPTESTSRELVTGNTQEQFQADNNRYNANLKLDPDETNRYVKYFDPKTQYQNYSNPAHQTSEKYSQTEVSRTARALKTELSEIKRELSLETANCLANKLPASQPVVMNYRCMKGDAPYQQQPNSQTATGAQFGESTSVGMNYRCTRGDAPYQQQPNSQTAPGAQFGESTSAGMNYRCTRGDAPYQQQPNSQSVATTDQPSTPGTSRKCTCSVSQGASARPPLDTPPYVGAYSSALPQTPAIADYAFGAVSAHSYADNRVVPVRLGMNCPCANAPVCGSMVAADRCHCQNDDEFFSLSSERDDVPAVSYYQSTISGNNKAGGLRSASPERPNINDARNAVILQLLQEVVHLIDEGDTAKCAPSCTDTTDISGIPATKMRNIGKMNDSKTDVGPFTSSVKITFCHSRKCTELSDMTPTNTPMPNMPCSLPCNLFIAPNMQCPPFYVTPLSGQQGMFPPTNYAQMDSQGYSGWKPGMETINYEMEDVPGAVVCDPEFIDDVTDIKLKSSTKGAGACRCRTDGTDACPMHNFEAAVGKSQNLYEIQEPMEYMKPDISNEVEDLKPQLEMKSENLYQSQDPMQNMKQDISNEADELKPKMEQDEGAEQRMMLKVRGDLFERSAAKSERISFGEETADETGIEYDDSEMYCAENDEECRSEKSRRKAARKQQKGSTDGDCDCCHCRAVREGNKDCMTIATPQQAQAGNDELRFFIDSIIMDLDAMEHARRKKKMEQNMCQKRASICPRQSFPVTITDVTDLGMSSLFVKWCIHDCFGIGGYEIYVDGYLTNRYFHCNHEAAVVCDVDVTKPHKIVLVAQPKLDDCMDCAHNDVMDKCRALLRQSDANKIEKKGPAALWTPSIYLYDPSNCPANATPVTRPAC